MSYFYTFQFKILKRKVCVTDGLRLFQISKTKGMGEGNQKERQDQDKQTKSMPRLNGGHTLYTPLHSFSLDTLTNRRLRIALEIPTDLGIC